MKNKKISILLVAFTTSIMIGCSNNISMEDKVIDSVVIDEDAKETTNENNEIKVSKVLETENIDRGNQVANSFFINKKIVYYDESTNYVDYEEEKSRTIFAVHSIGNLEVGTITNNINEENKRNIMDWDKKNIKGKVIRPININGDFVRILNNDKMYRFDDNCELKEISSYKKLFKEEEEVLRLLEIKPLESCEISMDGNSDLYRIYGDNGLEKMVIMDTNEDKYYEIFEEGLEKIKYKEITFLTVKDGKIYFKLEGSSSSIVYFENNKFYELISENAGISIKGQKGIYIKNNIVLFSGVVEEKNALWKYNIESKELTKLIDYEEGIFSEFWVNRDVSKIIIENIDFGMQSNRYSLNIANIDENLDIFNLKNITTLVSFDEKNETKSFGGWLDNSKEFYMTSFHMDEKSMIDEVNYEVYKVEN